MALPFGPCVFGVAIVVQTTFITNSDTIRVVATHVGTDPLDRACGQDSAVTADVEMIAGGIKSALAVGGSQGLLGKGTVLARGAAMYLSLIHI